MTTIIINEKTKKGRIVLNLVRELSCGKIIGENIEGENTPNDKTRLAIREASEGKTIKCTDFDDYLGKVK